MILDICSYAKKITNQENLCMAGGVALNCVANGLIIDSKIFHISSYALRILLKLENNFTFINF